MPRRAEAVAIDRAAAQVDAVDPSCIRDVLERVGVEHDEIGALAAAIVPRFSTPRICAELRVAAVIASAGVRPGLDETLHLDMRAQAVVARTAAAHVGAQPEAHARVLEPLEAARHSSGCPLCRGILRRVGCLQRLDLVRRERLLENRLVNPVRSRTVDLVPRGPEAGAHEHVRMLFQQRNQLIVDRFDRFLPPGGMRQAVDAHSQELLEVFELVDVRGDAQPVLVGLVDDGADHAGSHLAASRVVPDLDPSVDVACGQLLHVLPGLGFGRDAVDGLRQLARRTGVRRGQALTGGEEPRRVRRRRRSPFIASLIGDLAAIGPEAEHGADAVVRQAVEDRGAAARA